ncbi:STN domain-containing protein [Bradyrhizobium sp. Arg237L]|uniref:STN domain-containing protein n=1 Tax=Bradyrhizobium sp. Arg237L TaxID=3003352 RepID=UPI00249D9CA9|nr:STN domain-containing protein [Bradyrhizobium sp. Arg237L]MDI4234817.1 STN domain-containing protein [Bradyrhizobium sp. Arg237L]
MALGIAVTVFAFSNMSSRAQSQIAEPEIEFDIPAQPLDVALEAYIQATGLQILYKSALTASRNSSPVTGKFTPQRAIERLLAGTDLAASHTSEGAFTIRPLAVEPDRAVGAQRVVDYDAFLGLTQQRIIRSLCQNAMTRPGGYRAALQFSIGSTGLIEDPALLDTTGDDVRDRSLRGALWGLSIGQSPPANMPQPVTMIIARRSYQDECQRYIHENR